VRRIVLFGLTLAIAAGCLGLAAWQLRRLGARRASNAVALAGWREQELADSAGPVALLPNRRAMLSGRLDEAHEFLLRNRVVQGVPAVLVVTPLRRPGTDTAVLVNRGYVPAADGTTPPELARWSEGDRERYSGVLLPMPDRGDGDPVVYRGRETWRGLDLGAMRARLPYPIAGVYLVARAEPSEGSAHTVKGTVYPFRAEPPPMDDGPHLMYAVQWFGIAAAVAGFGWFFIFRGGAGRRVEE
jgi:surfeit locus 1 family protein